MFCGLGKEERTKIRKKKKEKTRKKILIAAKSGLVGMKGYLKTYKIQPYKIFLAQLKPFLTGAAFYAKLAGRFSDSKTEVT